MHLLALFISCLTVTHVFCMPSSLLRELQDNFGLFGDRQSGIETQRGRVSLRDEREERNKELNELRKLMKEISRLAQHRFFNKDKENTARDPSGGSGKNNEILEVKQAIGHPGFRADSPMADMLFEGDILLSPDQAKTILTSLKSAIRNAERTLRLGASSKRRVKRKMYKEESSRWINFPIEYMYHSDLSDEARKEVKAALDFWGGNTCLSFQRATRKPEGDYLQFFTGEGCYSMIGRVGGKQGISIGKGCERIGVTAHEIGHALGLWHEQSRPDSDCCIKLIKDNIIERMISNFLSRTWSDTLAYGIPYDLGSVMHYGPTAFTKDWSKITIATKLPGYQRTIGQRNFPSFYDVKVINEAYCNNICPRKSPCQRGGYPHPKDCNKCLCPSGLGGKHCERNEQSVGTQCGSVVDLRDGRVREIRSPGYPSPGYSPGLKCSWLFKVPAGRKIVLKFIGDFQFMCMTTCMDFVEIKNQTDLASTGMRYCCYTKPEGLIYSEDNEMIILFKTEVSRDVGFSLRVQMSKKVGIVQPSTPKPSTWGPVIPTLQSTTTDAPTTTSTTTTTRRTTTTSTRRPTTTSTTKRPTTTTTTRRPWTTRRPRITTTQPNVIDTWSAWTEWGYCSRTCGACGVKTRKRICLDNTCSTGDKEQYRRCNFNVCPGDSQCDRFGVNNSPWGTQLLTGAQDAYSFKCKLPSCCPPFKAVGKDCRLGLLSDPSADWTNWSKWAPCLGPKCGGCSKTTRKRICNAFECKGNSVQTRRCNTRPCKSCSATDKHNRMNFACGGTKAQCALHQILVRENYACPCCKPLTLVNGECIKK